MTFQQLSNQSYKQIDALINMLFYGDQRDRDIEPFVFDWNNLCDYACNWYIKLSEVFVLRQQLQRNIECWNIHTLLVQIVDIKNDGVWFQEFTRHCVWRILRHFNMWVRHHYTYITSIPRAAARYLTLQMSTGSVD